MRHKIIVFNSVIAISILLTTCGTNEQKYRSSVALDDYQYLIQEYGFTDEELKDFNVSEFVRRMHLRTEPFNVEQAHETFDALKDSFPKTLYNDIYMITTAEGGGKVKAGTPIDKVGYYVVAGNIPMQAVFDTKNKVFYLNDEIAHTMSDEQIDLITNIVDDYEINQWKNETNGYEEETTGSYYWKLVLQDADDNYYVYEGSTPDCSTFPNNYLEMDTMLMSICYGSQEDE